MGEDVWRNGSLDERLGAAAENLADLGLFDESRAAGEAQAEVRRLREVVDTVNGADFIEGLSSDIARKLFQAAGGAPETHDLVAIPRTPAPASLDTGRDPLEVAKAIAFATGMSEQEAANLLLILATRGFRIVRANQEKS